MDARRIKYINWWQTSPAEKSAPAPAVSPAPKEELVSSQTSVDSVKTTPLIQPLVVVPYVSTQQPMYYYNPEGEKNREEELPATYYEDLFDEEESYALPEGDASYLRSNTASRVQRTAESEVLSQNSVKSGRKTNVMAIISAILGIVYIALLFDFGGMIERFNYNYLYDGQAAFGIIRQLITDITGGGFDITQGTSILSVLIAASAVFTVITTLCSLITVAGRTSVFVKIIAALTFLLNAGAAVVAFTVVKIEFETYGLIILAALSLIIFILTVCARGKKQRV